MNKKALWLLSLLAMVPFLVSGAYEWLCQTVCDGTILAVIWMGVLLLAALCHTPFGKRPVDDEMNRQKLRIIKDTGIALLLSCLLCLVALILGKTLTALGIQEELSSYHIIALSSVLLGVLLFFLYAHYAKPHASRNAGSSGTEGGNHEGVLLMLLVTAAVGCQILTPLPMHLLFLTVFALLEIHVLMPGTQPSVPPPGKDLTDLLGREKVVSDCIERLKTPKKRTGEACNLALTGPWGSGKTFIMELVYNKLREDPAIHVIRLNPWHLQTLADIHKAVIQAIYSTVRAPSCFSSPALLWCLRSIASLCDAQSSTRFSEALERLVLNPGSMHTAGDVDALNTAIRKPVIIFLDDLERLNKNVLEQVLPMIDSLSQVNKLRFFVAINTETFNEFKTTRTEAAGYFHKVFTERIDIPAPDHLYFLHLAKTLIERQDLSTEARDFLLQLYGNNPEHSPIYFPKTPRTMLRAIQSVLAQVRSVAKNAYETMQDRDYYTRILIWSHFFTCLEAEFPELYSRLKYTDSTQRANTLIEIISQYVSVPPDEYKKQQKREDEKGEESKHYVSSSLLIHPSCPYVAPIRYILRFCDSVIYHSRTNKFELPRLNFGDLNVNMDGDLYSALSVSWKDILDAFHTSHANKCRLYVGEPTSPVYQERRRIFWQRATEDLLRREIPDKDQEEQLNEKTYCDVLKREPELDNDLRTLLSDCFEKHIQDYRDEPSDNGKLKIKSRAIETLANRDFLVNVSLIQSTQGEWCEEIKNINKKLNEIAITFLQSAIESAAQDMTDEKFSSLANLISSAESIDVEQVKTEIKIDWNKTNVQLVMMRISCYFCWHLMKCSLENYQDGATPLLDHGLPKVLLELTIDKTGKRNDSVVIPANYKSFFDQYQRFYKYFIPQVPDTLSENRIFSQAKRLKDILDQLLRRASNQQSC